MNPRYEHAFDDSLECRVNPAHLLNNLVVNKVDNKEAARRTTRNPAGAQQNGQQGGPQSGTNLTPQEQELLQQADELLREYQWQLNCKTLL